MIKNFESIDSLLSAFGEIAPVVAGVAVKGFDEKKILRYKSVSARQKSYRQFSIPKRSGGERQINAPTGMVKAFQSCVAALLAEEYTPVSCAMGFAPGRSVLTNAECHTGKTHVLNVDLKDFFTSIGAPKVEHTLVWVGVEPLTAQLISTLCCYPLKTDDGRIRNVLPQGSPASPILSNIACETMDLRLIGLSARFGLTYSRYADDITFSGSFQDLATGDRFFAQDGEFFQEMQQILLDNGFILNEKKTRLAHQGDRKEVTGLTVTDKVNVSRSFTKNLRAAIHQMEYFIPDDALMRQVSGRLAYMKMVKGFNDPTYLELRRKFRRIRHKIQAHAKKQRD